MGEGSQSVFSQVRRMGVVSVQVTVQLTKRADLRVRHGWAEQARRVKDTRAPVLSGFLFFLSLLLAGSHYQVHRTGSCAPGLMK
jgi:hypothetical protein